MAKKAATTPKNPFIYQDYVSPDYFCDRTAETEELIRNLQNGLKTVLISPHRIGKTGLIHNTCFHKVPTYSHNSLTYSNNSLTFSNNSAPG